MKFKALAVAVLVAAFGFVAPSAQAADTLSSKILVNEVTTHTGYDAQSTIEIESPSIVFCSGSCTLSVSARFANPNPWSSPMISLVTSGGQSISSAYLQSSSRTNYQTLNFYFSTNTNLDVTFHVVDTGTYKMFSGNRKLTRIQAGATPPSETPNLTWPTGVTAGATLNARFGNGLFRFVDAYLPSQMTTASNCIDVPIWVQPRDISTGAPKTDSSVLTIGLSFVVNGGSPTSASYSDAYWNKGVPTLVVNNVCGLLNRLGAENTVEVHLTATYRGQSQADGGAAAFIVTGQVSYKSINCLKGPNIKTITAANPVCPAGYAKTNIIPVNGHVPASAISCIKGFSVKRVTGILPTCPAGWRKR